MKNEIKKLTSADYIELLISLGISEFEAKMEESFCRLTGVSIQAKDGNWYTVDNSEVKSCSNSSTNPAKR